MGAPAKAALCAATRSEADDSPATSEERSTAELVEENA